MPEDALRGDVLDSLGVHAFRCVDGRFHWSPAGVFATALEDFEARLGAMAAQRRQVMARPGPYRMSYRVGGELFEETGEVHGDGTVSGLLRGLEERASPPLPLLSERELLDALNERRVRLAYQPIVEARTRAVHHHECLLRLLDAEGRVVPAPRVIASAERLGLVALLDRRALEVAARAMIARRDLHLALNVSAQTVGDRAAADDYLDALRMLGPAAQRLTLELTETIAVEDPTMAARFATRARVMGCSFAIDDFGSGFTTFRNLMAIEADSIKIDGDFVDDLLQSRMSQTFVRMMVDLAKTFGVQTVAERVETEEVAEMLTEFGVDRLQGYLFGKPEMEIIGTAA